MNGTRPMTRMRTTSAPCRSRIRPRSLGVFEEPGVLDAPGAICARLICAATASNPAVATATTSGFRLVLFGIVECP